MTQGLFGSCLHLSTQRGQEAQRSSAASLGVADALDVGRTESQSKEQHSAPALQSHAQIFPGWESTAPAVFPLQHMNKYLLSPHASHCRKTWRKSGYEQAVFLCFLISGHRL